MFEVEGKSVRGVSARSLDKVKKTCSARSLEFTHKDREQCRYFSNGKLCAVIV